MSLASITIEQADRDRWVAEVEVGGLISRRATVRGADFHSVMEGVARAYWGMMPAPIIPRPVAVETTMAKVRDASEGRVRAIPEDEVRAATDGSHDENVKDALIIEAEALGVDVDRRWGVPRLRQAIADRKNMAEPMNDAADHAFE